MFVSEIIDEASEILATTDQAKVFRKLQEAVQILMESGHYFHINQEVDVCTGWDGQTITLPRGIEVPLAVNIDGSPTYFRGRLFQYNVNKGGMYNPVEWAWDDRGFVSTVMDIRQPSQLVAVAEHEADAGIQIRVVGTDSNNRDLRTQMPDGTGVDGILVPVHAKSDFPYGTIEPDGVTLQTQSASVSPITQFISSAVHQFVSGQEAVLSFSSPSVTNSVLVAGTTYYIGVDNSNTIKLYKNILDAQTANNPITLQSILGLGTITLTDKRSVNLLTSISLNSVPNITIDSPNEVTFSTYNSGSLPSPLVSTATYFAQSLNSTDLQVYSSLSDAQNNLNPVLLTGNSGPFNVDIRKNIAPETVFKFSVPHYYQQNDSVQAYTSGGTLPQPLIAGENYFVNVIDTFTISLHTNAADSAASTPSVLVNPITLISEPVGLNSLVKLIPATSITGQTSQITANGLNISAPTGSGASTPVATVVGGVTNVRLITGGVGYTNAPNVVFSAPPSPPTGSSQITSQATGYAVMVLDTSGKTYSVGSIVITNAGQGYVTAPIITIDPPSKNIGFTVDSLLANSSTLAAEANTALAIGDEVYGNYIQTGTTIINLSGSTANPTITLSLPTTNTTTIVNASFIAVQTLGQNQAQAQSNIETSSVSYITIANGGSGYTYPPIVNITGGGGSGATASATVSNGVITSINVITEGTGYTSAPTITLTPSTGVLIQFASTGSLPSPLVAGVTYRAETPLNGNTGTFTLLNADYTPVNITGSPSGNFYVSLSRSFSVGLNSVWQGNFSGLTNGATIYLSSDYLLPTGVSTNIAYQIQNINSTNTTAQIYLNGSIVNPTALGVGQAYYAIRLQGYAKAQQSGVGGPSLLTPSSIQYLTNGASVTFTTSAANGTDGLPAPLSSNSSYSVQINGNNITLLDSTNNPVVFSSGGVPTLATSQIFLNIVRQFTAQPATGIVSTNSTFETGQQVTVRPNTNDTLPSGLVSSAQSTVNVIGTATQYSNILQLNSTSQLSVGMTVSGQGIPINTTITTINDDTHVTLSSSSNLTATNVVFSFSFYYYVGYNGGYQHPANQSLFNLYDTYNNALAGSTTGLIELSTTGNTTSSTFFVDSILPPTLVKAILHIEKPITVGYVSLYAYDYGRSNDMALIGQYHPSETNPKYRRIRIGKSCAWARIIYRMAHPKISSVYDYIPVENTRAIMAAIHAVDLEDKDFEEQSNKYWAKAFAYLRSQHESMTGHAMENIQVQNDIYGDMSDPVIDSIYGDIVG